MRHPGEGASGSIAPHGLPGAWCRGSLRGSSGGPGEEAFVGDAVPFSVPDRDVYGIGQADRLCGVFLLVQQADGSRGYEQRGLVLRAVGERGAYRLGDHQLGTVRVKLDSLRTTGTKECLRPGSSRR